MTRKQFNEWVAKMVEKYKNEKLFNDCDTRTIKDVVICVDRNHNVGIAKCHPDDEFNSSIGTAIAYARMKGMKIPKVDNYKKLSEMENGDIFHGITGGRYIFIGKHKKIDRYVVWKVSTEKYLEFVKSDIEFRMVD